MLRQVNNDTAEDIDRWSYPPNGGWIKLILLGILLAVALIAIGIDAWINQKTIWLFLEGMGTATGRTAKALAVTYLGAGLFSHFRWFWGILPSYTVYEIGSIAALFLMIGGGGYAIWWEIIM